MDKILFTEENLSKIHISQFEQFLNNHKREYGKRNNYIWINHSEYGYVGFKFFCSGMFCWKKIDNESMNAFDFLFFKIDPDYVQGDLTQFHVLFTQVYNEIMGYEIK